MRCERCRARIRGATWYCPGCGAPVRDLNVADSVAGRSRRRWVARLLPGLLLIGGLALALSGGWWLLGRRGGPEAGGVGETGAALGNATQGGATAAAQGSPPAAGGEAGQGPPAGSPKAAGIPTEAGEAGSMPDDPAGLPPRPGVPVWHLRRPGAPPRIDGNLDDWQTPLLQSQRLPLRSVVFGAESWSGPSDLEGEAFGTWDERALYLAIAVRDDRPSPPAAAAALYLGDSLELQLDSQLLADWEQAVFDADDWHIGLAPGDLKAAAAAGGRPAAPPGGLRPEAWVWRPEAREGRLDMPLGAEARPGGYALELALPWSLLGIDAREGLALGLSLSISDNDGDAPAQESMVSSSPLRRWDDPRTMGLLVLNP